MTDDRRRRASEIVVQVTGLPADRRSAFLAAACGDDIALRAEVDALLSSGGDTGGTMSRLTGSLAADSDITSRTGGAQFEGPGSRIGPYKLLQEIGEGGFGTVFMAEQTQPVVRRVALKIIKLGMDTRAVIARFEAERQALAMMDHPNIARVLDAGATESGRPYFVMELVRGDPITAYCDTHNLTTAERLGLFSQVCNAVQHAHTKGIIHRDIKPGNVLVTVFDGRPVPKVIDFGIAKATSARLTEKTLFTEHRALIGTPEYMSPEQAEMSGVDIDTRSDIYSLGVLLYELLTGTTPFDSRQLRTAAYGELQRIIREVEPQRPSTRLSTMASLDSVAAHRRIDPGRLARTIRGDLDWIVMRCLEKDRTRRYETANGLALDVQRHVAGDAVLAAPPGTTYRVRKFVRRNRGKVAAAAAVAAVLFMGVISTSLGLAWAMRERGRAVEAAELASHARRRAEESESRALAAEIAAKGRAAELEQISKSQASMLSAFVPSVLGAQLREDMLIEFRRATRRPENSPADQPPDDLDAEAALSGVNFTDLAVKNLKRSVLDRGLSQIESDLGDQPIVQARLLSTIASSLFTLGRYSDSATPMERAVVLFKRELGAEHPDTLVAIHELAYLYRYDGRLDKAEPLWREVAEVRMRTLGPVHEDTLNSVYTLGVLMNDQNRYLEAEAYLRQVIARCRETSEGRVRLRWALADLGLTQLHLGELEEADALTLEALEMRRKDLGADHRDTLWSLTNLGRVRQRQGRTAEAEQCFRESLAGRRRLLGDEHPLTLGTLNYLASLLESNGRLPEALALRSEALEGASRSFGSEHVLTFAKQRELAATLQLAGSLEQAEQLLRTAIAGFTRLRGMAHQDTRACMGALASVVRDSKRLDDAAVIGADALRLSREVLPTGDPSLCFYLRELAKTLIAMSRFKEAEALALEAYAAKAATDGDSDEGPRQTIREIVGLYEAWHGAEPAAGHDVAAAKWRARLESD